MRDFRRVVASAILALAPLTATVNPSKADSGSVRFLYGMAGVVAGGASGTGTLIYHGKTYPFEASGVSLGATLTLTVDEVEGRALNLRAPGDLNGNYIAVGASGVIAAGKSVARLRNANGVVLVLRGTKVGAGLSIHLARITIRML